MSEYLTETVWQDLAAARRPEGLRISHIESDGRRVPVRRSWVGGFSLVTQEAARLRGAVDLYDGARHLGRCLVVALETRDDETLFGVKRRAVPRDRAPVDFEQAEADMPPPRTA